MRPLHLAPSWKHKAAVDVVGRLQRSGAGREGAGDLGRKEARAAPRTPKDSAAEVRHHTQLSPGNCVTRVYLHPRAHSSVPQL